MAGHATDHARAQRTAEAAVDAYADAAAAPGSRGLQPGLERYGVPADADARFAASRHDTARGAGAARRQSDLDCLTQAVYYEARGESARGQAAVAQVVLNRVKHPAFPRSICAVVYQGAGRKGCQFSFACDGSLNRRREPLAWKRAHDVAQRALAGAARADVGSATHFHTTAVSPAWAPQMLRVASVGAHVFYKFAPRGLKRPPEPSAERVVLASVAADAADLRVVPALAQEKAVEASLDSRPAQDAKVIVANDGKAAKPAVEGAPKSATASASKPDLAAAKGAARPEPATAPPKAAQTAAQKAHPARAAEPTGADAAALASPAVAAVS